MDCVGCRLEIGPTGGLVRPSRNTAWMVMLLWFGFCLACTHSQGRGSLADAADVAAGDASGPSSGALVDMLEVPQDGWDRQPSSSDGADTATAGPESSNPWLDAGWIIDGPCSDNPSDLMQVLATSLGSSFCARTASSQPEGYITFDSDGQVTLISGYRVPANTEAWVDSLATYSWPCLAGQTIAYGCS